MKNATHVKFAFTAILMHTFRNSKVCSLVVVVALGLAICVTDTLAHSGAGSIQGTVTDATGAVIPEATIHVVNQATNVATDTTSNAVGFYMVPSLFTGTYGVTIKATGMKTYKSTVELQVAQAAIINPTITAGDVTQQVEVSADVIQLTGLPDLLYQFAC